MSDETTSREWLQKVRENRHWANLLRTECEKARAAGRAEAAEEIRRSIAARREARVQACAPDREYSEREVIGLEIDALEEVLSLLSAAPAAREDEQEQPEALQSGERPPRAQSSQAESDEVLGSAGTPPAARERLGLG